MGKALVLALAALIAAVLTRLLGDKLKVWILWLTTRLLRIAIERLPEAERERFSEEWASHINEVTGEISKVAVALGYIFAAPEMAALLKSEASRSFQRILTVERQRAKRSQRPFILLLLAMGDDQPSKGNRETLEKVLYMLSTSSRDSDVTGWWSNSVLGVIFTALGCDDLNTLNTLLSTRTTRVINTLRQNLSLQQFNQMCMSFHLFPEEWNPNIRPTPADPDAPVRSPLKPKPHLRSGGAIAVPEPDERKIRKKMVHIGANWR
jgi:hypothetical protein